MLASMRAFEPSRRWARPVLLEVEIVHTKSPAFLLDGLPEPSAWAMRERVKAAIAGCGFKLPHERVYARLSPTYPHRANAPAFDLPLATALLRASAQVGHSRLAQVAMVGGLAPDGGVRPVSGMQSIVGAAAEMPGYETIAVAPQNALEVTDAEGIEVVALANLGEVAGLAGG